MSEGVAERCSWCARAIAAGDGYRLRESPGARRAAFCRLEHVIPWAIRGAHWEAAGPCDATDAPDELDRCAHCQAPLGDVRLTLTRQRGEHRIPDAFCSVDHLAAWAKAGGRWR